MVTVNLIFSKEEVKSFFESAGLVVKEVAVPAYSKQIDAVPGREPDTFFNVVQVENPHTGIMEDITTAFLRCVVKNKVGLVSDIEKLEIINSFK